MYLRLLTLVVRLLLNMYIEGFLEDETNKKSNSSRLPIAFYL